MLTLKVEACTNTRMESCNCCNVAGLCAEAPFTECGSCGSSLLGSVVMLLVGLVAAAAPRRPRARVRPSVPGRAGLGAIRAYQRWLSPRLPIVCRFVPSCSAYGATAVERFGLLAGGRLTAARIARCTHAVPFGRPDPVP
jgi:putative membrane protein insertion efficiency factor